MALLPVDACVIGAGPAGCVMAARLAQLGFAVCMVERAPFPRPHLGESLSPGVLPLIETIGARRGVEASGVTRVRAVVSNWEGGFTKRVDPREQGLLVDRGRFDAVLLGRARTLGVMVLQPAVVRERTHRDDAWHLAVDAGGTSRRLRARFVIDATGRAAWLPGRRRRTGPRTVALHAYWEGGRLPTQPRIEAGADAWYWGVPLPDGLYNTLVFVDGASLRGRSASSRDSHFRGLIGRSRLMDGCERPRLAGPVLAADATPYLDELSVTRTQIKVGDSALAIDPLSSSGVQKAIQTALSGAIVVNTLLRKPEYSDAAIRFYGDSLVQASDRHRAWATGHYATVSAREPASFWSARSAPQAPLAPAVAPVPPEEISTQITSHARVQLSADAELVEVPRLGADFVGLGPALRHPALETPVAYLGGWELAPLVREVRTGMTPLQVVHSWSPRVPFESGIAIAGWMLGRGILVPSPESLRVERP